MVALVGVLLLALLYGLDRVIIVGYVVYIMGAPLPQLPSSYGLRAVVWNTCTIGICERRM
jgi:hypothetical protein